MKQNVEHGKKKLATKILSFILALVFVFSIFSGMASAECEMINEHVYAKFHPTAAPEVEKQCECISSTCEESKWERTAITTTKGNLEIITERTYVCKCENTNKSAIESRKETEWENDIVAYDYPFKTDYLTGGATCPKPCVTHEQLDAALNNAIHLGHVAIALEVDRDIIMILSAALLGTGLLAAFGVAAALYADNNLSNARSSCDAAYERYYELHKLPYCDPKPQRPGGCN